MTAPQASSQYRPSLPLLWWTKRRTYFVFAMRELSCVFVAWFVAFMVMLIHAVGQGPARYEDFLDLAGRPWVVVINILALAFLIVHAVTWFQLAPKAMVVKAGRQQVPPAAIMGAHFAGWLIISLIVMWVVLR
ncbi:hypothetical protein [Hoyosella subflava]|uniref:Fumarate reductase subunit C n=1 Tax=Hoyosella subflava (strain DSM 45089 / JCM 17490 / NBRC 109087 / DQS3-9A1) TaxID=443218 RepID=F6EKS5_HOYSD|nr:hypothetical protein [Hoyosella subflava]AEF41405.1 Fumarate reductase subunit C [Hoyosella subflava DQS3-9A1]